MFKSEIGFLMYSVYSQLKYSCSAERFVVTEDSMAVATDEK